MSFVASPCPSGSVEHFLLIERIICGKRRIRVFFSWNALRIDLGFEEAFSCKEGNLKNLKEIQKKIRKDN